ncbi:MAG: DUF1592 domain-containing protein [Enhygromyxa sp.]
MGSLDNLPAMVAGIVLVTLTALGCETAPADANSGSDTGSDPDADPDSNSASLPASCSGPIDPGPAPIRRLTRVEYNNTVYQLLGDNSRPADAFPADEEASGFDNQATTLVVSPLLAEHYMHAAAQLAAAHGPKLLEDLPGCLGDGVDPQVCRAEAEGFVQRFGKLAHRRPLTAAEVQAYLEIFEQGTMLGDPPYSPRDGVELVVEAMLQSPHFLYRVEFGMPNPDAAEVVELSSYEIASRLSYLLWNTMPDAALFEAAEADELRSPAQIEAQARRMLEAPRAREAVKNFHRQWLRLDDIRPRIAANGKSFEVYPDYRAKYLPLWQAETELFLDHAIFEEDANVEELFTASYSLLNQELAEFYGVSGPGGEAFVKVELDPGRHAGFLTQAGLLALHAKPDRSSPIHRGKFVREVLLCQTPPPPPDVVPEAPSVDESKTTREQFTQHSEDPLCAGCHQLMDPIGFGFEHFDGIGRYRETEWGLPIDASGELIGTDVDGPYEGVVELAAQLAASEQVKHCIVSQWFRFGYGRVETSADSCSIDVIREAFAAADYDVKELIVALTRTDAFRYRRAGSGN